MSGSSSGLTVRPGDDTRVKSEPIMDELMDGQEDTREPSYESMISEGVEESEEAKKLNRKREYNRIAQREFRRRRKERMTKLEESQSVTVTEQGQEIQYLRRQNYELRANNELLRAQIYGNNMQGNANMALPPVVPSSRRQTGSSASSIMETMANDGAMMDALGMAPDMLPAHHLAITSSMLPGAIQAFAGTIPSSGNMQGMHYSMAHPAGSRGSPQDISGSIDYSAVASGSSSFQTMGNMPFTMTSMATTSQVTAQMSMPNQHASSSRAPERPNLIAMLPANRIKISNSISTLFSPIIQEAPSFPPPTSNQACPRHLQLLASMGSSLPGPFRPTPTQLTTPHYYGVDLLPSPALRDRLCRAGPDVSAAFLHEFDCLLLTPSMDEHQRLTIWGEDPYNELSWEFSAEMLSRWGWLAGRVWAERANFWRTQRNQDVLPLPVEAPEASLWAMWQQLRLGVLGGESMVGSAVVGLAGLGLHPHNQHMQ
ncbi:hypothetical protein VE03_06358 [Pseudogymnoascus sp. 23342-1-I1]|nr:hypothetical protein VE03_06358 [Pseudogymnoascus sp. 23342-1-I1]